MNITPVAGRVRRVLLGAVVAMGLAGPAFAQTLYVANAGSNTVSIIRPNEGNSIHTVAVGANPQGIAISPNGARAYAANAGSGTVSVIDTASHALVHTISVETTPYSVAVSPNGARAYSANFGSDTVSVIDTASNAVVATVTVEDGPISVAVSPDNAFVYAVNFRSSSVSVIQTSDNAVIKTLSIPSGAFNAAYHVAFSKDGNFAYVVEAQGPTVTKIRTSDHTVMGTYATGLTPHASAVHPNGTSVYVASYGSSGVVYGYDTTTLAETAATSVGSNPHSLAFSSDGSRLYVANYGAHGGGIPGTVSVINTATNTVVDTITVGVNPSSIAVGPTTTSTPAAVPTLTEWAMILLAMALASFAALTLQRRRQTA